MKHMIKNLSLLSVLLTHIATAGWAQVNIRQLCGNWANDEIRETWNCTDSCMMEGYAFEKKDNQWIKTEYLMLVNRNQNWYYIAIPEGQQPTVFVLDLSKAGTMSFINGVHDFPQQINYNFNKSEQLTITLGILGNTPSVKYTLLKCNEF